MKKVNFEIKRMLSLLESKMGDVKPLVSEQVTDNPFKPKGGSNLDVLRRIKEVCLTGKGFKADQISDISYWAQDQIDFVNKDSRLSKITAGEPYVMFERPGERFFVFSRGDIKGKTPVENVFYAIQSTDNQAYDKSDPNYSKPHFDPIALDCRPFFERSKSVTSDLSNLSADQSARIEDLISNLGAKETRFSFTTQKPQSGTGIRYVAVDLATGIGTDGNKYIEKTDLSGLGREFQTPGKYYIWVNLGQEMRRRDLPADVEKLLATMGYTREEPPIGSAEEYRGITLKQLCDQKGTCSGGLLDYANGVEGGRKVWPMSEKQRAEAEKSFGVDIKTSDEMVSSSGRGRQTRRQLKAEMGKMANKQSCRTAFEVLGACARSNSDDNCSRYLNNVDITRGMNYTDALFKMKDLALECDAQNISLSGALGGGKSFEETRQFLRGTKNKFSPYFNSSESSEISLEESLTRNIRNTINEHILMGRVKKRL